MAALVLEGKVGLRICQSLTSIYQHIWLKNHCILAFRIRVLMKIFCSFLVSGEALPRDTSRTRDIPSLEVICGMKIISHKYCEYAT